MFWRAVRRECGRYADYDCRRAGHSAVTFARILTPSSRPSLTAHISSLSGMVLRKGLFLSEPLVSRSENRAAVILSRRLDDGQGGFAGVVTAIVDLEDLKQFYAAVNLGGDSAMQLLRDDGTLLVRNPPTPAAVGQRFPKLLPRRTRRTAGL